MKMKIKIFFLLAILGFADSKAGEPLLSKNGMVVSAHPLASEAGIEILKKGGNAVDAAIAVEFTLSVVFPNAGNIGGGGFLIYRAADGSTQALDYREAAPGNAHRDMYLDASGEVVNNKSLSGGLAAGVPGTVAGMVEAHKKYGKLSWNDLLEPAIQIAEQGFRITEKQSFLLNYFQKIFIEHNPPECVFIRQTPWKAGDRLVQPELAKTLRLIRDNGRDGFYRGETAKNIVSQMKQSGGIITSEDLGNYKAIWRQPVEGRYKDYKIISMSPPSSGGIALLSMLKAVEKYPLSRWGFQQDSTVQLMIEVQRRVYADRAEYLGDPDFWDVPQAELLDANYIAHRMSDISFEQASLSSGIKPALSGFIESKETTHYSIVDKDRNAVSATTTLNGAFGSGIVVQGSGFFLNNEMDDFSVKPGTPNMYGLSGGEANAIAPNKRMLSSMTPTILEKNGSLYMVVGSPGGSTIITSVFQTILNIVEFGKDPQTAVSLPRFHHQWLPDNVQAEEGAIPETVRNYLGGKGYEIKQSLPLGKVEVIVVKENQILEGGADPRGDDKAAGY
jgi:gamma-glutamyltranspeptidase/glutathione hydrolase